MKEWFDDDSFWIDQYPLMFAEDRFEAAAVETEFLVSLISPEGRDILDLGAGPGRFSIPLARQGFNVTAVDRTAYLLEMGRKRAERAAVSVEWIRADMRDFVREEAYDAVISMLTSFGYFRDRADDMKVLRNMKACLRPGGVCLIDLKGKEAVARTLQPTSEAVLGDGTTVIRKARVVDDWSRVENELTIVRADQARRTFRFDSNLYSGQELKDCLQSAGFGRVRLFGDLKGGEFGFDAERLIAVSTK